MSKEKIFEQILEYALSEGRKATDKYYEEHAHETNSTVGWGDVYVVGDSAFTKWYRKMKGATKDRVAIEAGGGTQYGASKLYATEVRRALSEFGVDTVDDVHLD